MFQTLANNRLSSLQEKIPLGLGVGLSWMAFLFPSACQRPGAPFSPIPIPALTRSDRTAKPSTWLELFRQDLRCFALEIPLQVEITSKLHLDVCLKDFHFNCLLFSLFFLSNFDICLFFSFYSFLKTFPSSSFPQWFLLDRWLQSFSFFIYEKAFLNMSIFSCSFLSKTRSNRQGR